MININENQLLEKIQDQHLYSIVGIFGESLILKCGKCLYERSIDVSGCKSEAKVHLRHVDDRIYFVLTDQVVLDESGNKVVCENCGTWLEYVKNPHQEPFLYCRNEDCYQHDGNDQNE